MSAKEIFEMTRDEIYNYFTPLLESELERYKKVYMTCKDENIFDLYPYEKPGYKTGKRLYKKRCPILDINWNSDRQDITIEIRYKEESVKIGVTDDKYKKIYYIETSWEGEKDYD